MPLDVGFDFSDAEFDIERVWFLSASQVLVRASLQRHRQRLFLIRAFGLELDRSLQKSCRFRLSELHFQLGTGLLIGKQECPVLDEEFFDDWKLRALLREWPRHHGRCAKLPVSRAVRG